MSLDPAREGSTRPGRLARAVRQNLPPLAFDAIVIVAAYVGALFLRFEGSVPSPYVDTFLTFVPLVVLIQLATNASFGLYGEWRLDSARLALRIAGAGSAAGFIIAILIAFATQGERPVPLSVVILGTFMSSLGMGAVRSLDRWFPPRGPSSHDDQG